MQLDNQLNSLSHDNLLELIYQPDCPDEVFNQLLNRYAVDNMWAKRIVEHPNAKDETKMRIIQKGYHLRDPAVAEALLATLPSTARLVDELRVAYADFALNLRVVGVNTGTLEQQKFPLLHSAVGDLIKPEYCLGQVVPADGAKLTPTDANDLIVQFSNAYKNHPNVSAIPKFIASIQQRCNQLTEQSMGYLAELTSRQQSVFGNMARMLEKMAQKSTTPEHAPNAPTLKR